MFAVLDNLDDVAATRTTLPVSSIDSKTTGDIRGCDAVGAVQIGAQHVCRRDHKIETSALGDCRYQCPWMNATRPQHFAAIDIANTTHHALVEQCFCNCRFRFVVVKQTRCTLVQISIWRAQIGAEPTGARMSILVELAIGLDHRCIECNRDPFVCFNDGAGLMTSFAPLLSRSIQMPRTGHPHVRVQNDAIIKNDLKVLAMGVDPFDCRTGLRSRANQTWSIKSSDGFPDERGSQSRSCSIDRVTFRHTRMLCQGNCPTEASAKRIRRS